MNDKNATDVILISGVIIAGSTMMRRKRRKQGGVMKTLTFGFLLTFVLLLIAVPMPAIAKALAYMGIVGALTANSKDVFGFVTELGS